MNAKHYNEPEGSLNQDKNALAYWKTIAAVTGHVLSHSKTHLDIRHRTVGMRKTIEHKNTAKISI
jgi:hypothetical protein